MKQTKPAAKAPAKKATGGAKPQWKTIADQMMAGKPKGKC